MTADPANYKPEYALEKIGGKWKMPILWRLQRSQPWRYSELKRELGDVSHKMLSQQLKELERDGFITRFAYPVVPPKVEYTLTDKGRLTLPALQALCELNTALQGMQCEGLDVITPMASQSNAGIAAQ